MEDTGLNAKGKQQLGCSKAILNPCLVLLKRSLLQCMQRGYPKGPQILTIHTSPKKQMASVVLLVSLYHKKRGTKY